MSTTDFNPAFLSQETLEAQPAPLATRGVIGWLRHNLFSSLGNAALTLLAIALIAVVIPPILKFTVFNAVWDGLGRDACLEDKVGHPVGAAGRSSDRVFRISSMAVPDCRTLARQHLLPVGDHCLRLAAGGP